MPRTSPDRGNAHDQVPVRGGNYGISLLQGDHSIHVVSARALQEQPAKVLRLGSTFTVSDFGLFGYLHPPLWSYWKNPAERRHRTVRDF